MKLIYISGIDGCGKTTQAKLLVKSLEQKGFDICYQWLRWEPTFQNVYKFFMKLVLKKRIKETTDRHNIENDEYRQWMSFKRRILTNNIFRKLWWYHACADYYFTNKKKISGLASDILVVDRYLDDFIIDQACNLGIPPEKTHRLLDNFILSKFKKPNINIIIDIPAKVGYQRKKDGTPINALAEREIYYKKHFYSNSIHIDGTRGIKEIALDIENHIIRYLKDVKLCKTEE